MFDQKTNNINYWLNKTIKRPVVDNFIPGKEKTQQYKDIEDITTQTNKNNINVNSYKNKRK